MQNYYFFMENFFLLFATVTERAPEGARVTNASDFRVIHAPDEI